MGKRGGLGQGQTFSCAKMDMRPVRLRKLEDRNEGVSCDALIPLELHKPTFIIFYLIFPMKIADYPP